MERIGNVGWFISDEEYETIQEAINKVRVLLDSVKALKSSSGKCITEGDGMDNVRLNEKIFRDYPATPCPNCPWRPWQGPWQGPWYVGPVDVNRFEVGDGEWWKHQPYCTSTSEDNPNVVKDTKTNGDNEGPVWENERH